MAKNLTQAQARRALKAIERQFGVTNPAAADAPKLQRDYVTWGGSVVRWAIVWEGGPFEWTYGAFEPHRDEYGGRVEGVTRPAQVFAEAINTYALGLHLDESMPAYTPKTWAQLDAEEPARKAALAARLAEREALDAHKVMGVTAEILRRADGYDCTNGGITSKVTTVVVVGDGFPRQTEATPERPAMRIEQRTPDYWAAIPLDQPADKVGPMAGGNYIVIRGQRPISGAIPVHDRFETQAQYDAMFN